MKIFKRTKTAAPVTLSPIAEFWRWWNDTGAAQLDDALANGSMESLVGELSDRVRAIDPSLEWETSRGRNARHRLVVTAAGVAELRPMAERWLRAGPRSNEVWEFAAARQRDPDAADIRLDFGGTSIQLGDAEAEWSVDEMRMRVDVRIWHPVFEQLDERGRLQVTYLLLDTFLGEDDVERWLGGIDIAPLADGRPVADLAASVDSLAARPTSDDQWASS